MNCLFKFQPSMRIFHYRIVRMPITPKFISIIGILDEQKVSWDDNISLVCPTHLTPHVQETLAPWAPPSIFSGMDIDMPMQQI